MENDKEYIKTEDMNDYLISMNQSLQANLIINLATEQIKQAQILIKEFEHNHIELCSKYNIVDEDEFSYKTRIITRKKVEI